MAHRAAASGVAAVEVYTEAALGLRHGGWAWLKLGVGCTSGIAINRMVRRGFELITGGLRARRMQNKIWRALSVRTMAAGIAFLPISAPINVVPPFSLFA